MSQEAQTAGKDPPCQAGEKRGWERGHHPIAAPKDLGWEEGPEVGWWGSWVEVFFRASAACYYGAIFKF